MDGGKIHERMDDSDSENTISDAKSISESDTFDENHRLGQVPNLRYLFYNQPKSLLFIISPEHCFFLQVGTAELVRAS